MPKVTPKLVLIDGNAIMHRSYHALPLLSTKSGELVNAVYGFTSTLLSVIEKFRPEYLAVTFDLKGPTFRHAQFSEYKATRAKAPDEFYQQIPRVKEVVKTFNVPIFELAGFEADDLIGTLSAQAEKLGVETIIVTGDLDTLQLITDNIKVYTLRRGLSDSVIYDQGEVFRRYGLEPAQVIDLKGLAGDASDNIPGVKGVGEKTAITLLQKYGSVEGVYQHLEEIKGAVAVKLEKDRVQAKLSKQLATIDCTAPVVLDLEKTRVADYDRQKVVSLFGELNFFSLAKRLPVSSSNGARPVNSSANSDGAAQPQIDGVKDFKYKEIDRTEADSFVVELKQQPEISIATDRDGQKLLGLAFSWKTGRAGYVSTGNLNDSIREVLASNQVKKTGFDLKADYRALAAADIRLGGIGFDAMLAAYVLDPGEKQELSKIVFAELGEEVSGPVGKGQMTLGVSEPDNRTEKICQRADYALKLKEVLEKKIDAISHQQSGGSGTVAQVFEKLEMPLVRILAEMEIAGIKFNPLIFRGIAETLAGRIKKLEEGIFKLAGAEFNINSPQQLAEVLFVKMQLPTAEIKKGKTGYSTAAGELEKLRGESKIIEKIEEYRELAKLKNTYLDTLPLLVDANKRIHTTFNQAVTATGRLSSSDPNLQNIPIRTELGQLLRTAFVAEDGWTLVSADYSQIDLRCVAHVSQDAKMIEAFRRGDDIHRMTAAEVNKIPLSQVTEKMRSAAKALNFGVIYGMSVFGFAASAGIDRDEAKKFIDEYMEKFSGIARYIRETKMSAKERGYVETLMGRRRNIPEINSPNFQVQNSAERMAINMPIQGLSADIVKLAMVKIDADLGADPDARMILQVHDEIILEVKRERAEEIARRVKEIMEGVYELSVPLLVGVKIGDSWGEI